jgi:EmrB/QacA subfamily drug resistance transporter
VHDPTADAAPATQPTAGAVRFGTPIGRWILVATVLGSGIAMLDGTVVNVALPAIGEDFGAGVAGLQWVVTAYLLTLASLILLGGSLGDRFGRRRVFSIGVVWFTIASVGCAAAPTLGVLIAARAVQGVGGALLVPGSLAIIEASFHPDDRGRAIGAWSGLGGAASAIGPFLGGYLVTAASWRLVFLINVPLAAGVLVAARHVPESRNPEAGQRVDVAGAVAGAIGLGGLTFALIEAGSKVTPFVLVAGICGVLGLIAFVAIERRTADPMLPLGLFSSRQFTAANIVTVLVYAALGGVFFLLVVTLQQVLGFSPLEAGASLFPATVIMLLFSSRSGALAARIGPRLQMTVGPLIVACGLLLMTRIGVGSTYVADVLPAVLVFGAGLTVVVAPLTATVLGAVDQDFVGVASGVNNAVARVGQLLAVAVLPLAAGISGDDYLHPPAFADGFHTAVLISAVLTVLGGCVAFVGIRNPPRAPAEPGEHQFSHCALDAPPLRTAGAVASGVTPGGD